MAKKSDLEARVVELERLLWHARAIAELEHKRAAIYEAQLKRAHHNTWTLLDHQHGLAKEEVYALDWGLLTQSIKRTQNATKKKRAESNAAKIVVEAAVNKTWDERPELKGNAHATAEASRPRVRDYWLQFAEARKAKTKSDKPLEFFIPRQWGLADEADSVAVKKEVERIEGRIKRMG